MLRMGTQAREALLREASHTGGEPFRMGKLAKQSFAGLRYEAELRNE
jgi:hypothetical protein